VYPTTKFLPVFSRVSIIYEGNREINYGNCISASRPNRITPGTLWIGRSNDKNGVYPTTQLLHGVARVSIKNDVTREINFGNGFSASRPDRITVSTHCIGGSIDKNVVYPTTHLLPCVARVSIKNEGTKKSIMEFVSQLRAPTALSAVLYGYDARMIRMECNPPHNYYTALLGFL
jgi:hypothetical protein